LAHQHKGRARHRGVRDTQSPGQSPREGGFSGADLADQREDVAGPQILREISAEFFGLFNGTGEML